MSVVQTVCAAIEPFHTGGFGRRFVGGPAENVVGGDNLDGGNSNQHDNRKHYKGRAMSRSRERDRQDAMTCQSLEMRIGSRRWDVVHGAIRKTAYRLRWEGFGP